MDLQKNGYWLGMGGAAALALILFAALVPMTVGADIKKKEGELKKKVNQLKGFAGKPDDQVGDVRHGLPILALRDYWVQRQNLLRGESERIRDHFRKLDASFEKITGGFESDPARFVPQLNRNLASLDEEFKDLLPAGKKLNDIAPVIAGDVSVDQISQVQKRYYLAEAIAQATFAAGGRQLTSIVFEEPPARPADQDPSRVSVDVLVAKATILMPLGGADPGKKRRELLSQLNLPPNVPTGVNVLVSAIVRHPSVVMRVSGLNIQTHAFEYPELEPWKVFPQKGGAGAFGSGGPSTRKSFDSDVYVATQDDSVKDAKEPPPELREPDVAVTIRVEALDFRIPKGQGDGS